MFCKWEWINIKKGRLTLQQINKKRPFRRHRCKIGMVKINKLTLIFLALCIVVAIHLSFVLPFKCVCNHSHDRRGTSWNYHKIQIPKGLQPQTNASKWNPSLPSEEVNFSKRKANLIVFFNTILSISPSIDHVLVEVQPIGMIAQLFVCTLMVSPMGQSHNRH